MAAQKPDGIREQLIQLLKDRSVRTGNFVLSSGRPSTYYIDARRTTMSANGLHLVGALGVLCIHEQGWQEAASVGGLTLGADPVSYAIALASRDRPPILNAFTVRKEQKEHGLGRIIEGCFEAETKVVVIEDVITSGASALRAIQAVRAAGGTPIGVLGVVDREEGGLNAIMETGVPARAMVSIRHLGIPPA